MPVKFFSGLSFIELPSDPSFNLILFLFPGFDIFSELIDIFNPPVQALF